MKSSTHFIQTTLLAFLAMLAFSANAVICRWALDAGLIDPISFTNLRLLSAAMMLFVVMFWASRHQHKTAQLKESTTTHNEHSEKSNSKGSWKAAILLFIYAITFSYGYVAISTATGALLLAGIVQLTMVVYALRAGDRLHTAEWIGGALALIGLLYLVYPELTAPTWWGLVMVFISAYTWALYTLKGRISKNPLQDTAYNFYRTLPMVAVAGLAFIPFMQLSWNGVILAVISGAITTGFGYILWYQTLTRISSSLASATQLLVPLMAAFGAAWLINEPITMRFIIAAILMLGGLSLVVLGRHRQRE